MRQIVIRLDDIGPRSTAQDVCMSAMCERGFRISLGVVPGWLDRGNVIYITRLADTFPGAVEVHLHGYRHENHARPNETPYEFGPARSASVQLRELARGTALLRGRFPDLFVPVFSPPYGEFDKSTLHALKELEFALLTALTPDDTVAMAQASSVIDLCEWNPPKEKSLERLTAEWSERAGGTLSVIVLHPRFMEMDALPARLRLLESWLGSAPCCLFGELCTASHQDGFGNGVEGLP